MTFTYMHCTKVYIRTSTSSPLAVKISSCSSALGSRSDGQRPTLTAAFGGSVRRAPRRPSSPRRAGGRSSTRRSRSPEASTISGRTGPLDPGHFDASRGDMSVLGHRLISGARGIAKEWCGVTTGFPVCRYLSRYSIPIYFIRLIDTIHDEAEVHYHLGFTRSFNPGGVER